MSEENKELKVETTKEDLKKETKLSKSKVKVPESATLDDPLSTKPPETAQLWDVEIKLSGGMIGVATVRAINKIMAEHTVRMSVTFEASKNYSKN